MIRILLVSAILSILGCSADRYSWNERTTVTVQTPNGIVTGTSVIEFRAVWCEDGCGFPPMNYQWDYTGEAVVVEVLPDRYLFVLPGTFISSASRYAPELFSDFEDTGDRLQTAGSIEEVIEVPREFYPSMLTFLEMGDRDSLREVDADDMTQTFDAGVEIVSVTLEVTQERVSEPRVDDLMRWSCDPDQPLMVPNESPRGWYHVNTEDFMRGSQICVEE